ncbi:MAG TPA: sulfotransferase [Stellaceae bacterium]|nr:sulfotransferase [Stellaceae bacterium]
MKTRRAAGRSAAAPARNEPCPCGSGRKFKVCCGVRGGAGTTTPPPETASHAASWGMPSPAGGVPGLGPLTEVGGLRRAAERFGHMSPDLPTAATGANPLPRQRAVMAERHYRRGESLFAAGRRAAAISAFTRATRLDPRNAAAHRAFGRALLQDGNAGQAAETLRWATALEDDAAAFCDLALALRQQRLNDEAVAAYRQAVALAPALAEAHVGLADLLELAGEPAQAAEHLRAAAALGQASAEARLCLARALTVEGKFAAAETASRNAAALNPDHDRVQQLLGSVLVRQGRFDEAVVAFDRALTLNPRQVAAHFGIVEARRCTEADRSRLAPMLAALGDASLGDEDHEILHFAAGKLLDDLGDYAAAIQHFDAANRIRERYANFDGVAFADFFDRLRQRFTREFLEARAMPGHNAEIPLLIVGLPRSGTTLVEQILTRHPQIAAGGELDFWIKQAHGPRWLGPTVPSAEAGRPLAQEYLSLLRRIAPNAARVTDKLPFNVLCLGVVHELLPKARVIQCRRHPVDTCLSLYFTRFQQTMPFVSNRGALVTAYREYARLMDHWRAVLPPDRLIDIEYEALVSDRESVTRRLVEFAGLEWDDACLSPEHNRRPVATASLWQVRQPVYATSVGRWRNYQPWLGELRQLLSPEECRGRPTR